MRNLAGQNPFYIVPPRPVHSDTFPTYFARPKVARFALCMPRCSASSCAALALPVPSSVRLVLLVCLTLLCRFACSSSALPPRPPRPLLARRFFPSRARSSSAASCVSCGAAVVQPSTTMDTPSHALSNATQQVSNTHAHAPSRRPFAVLGPWSFFAKGRQLGPTGFRALSSSFLNEQKRYDQDEHRFG